jgi:hypothetical protein
MKILDRADSCFIPPPHNKSMFTTEQILLIEQIVDRRILCNKTKQRAQSCKLYHTVVDIRQLIADNEATLRQQLGSREFDIAVLRYELSKLTTLFEGDHEWIGGADSAQKRWDSQVLNAIRTPDWPECPIEPGSKLRSYRIKAIVQLECTTMPGLPR